jgi:deazaflavin-dependent oxidoreductase (nitroreductase family)
MNDDLDKTVSAIDSGRPPDWINEHVRRYRETGGKEGHLWDSTAMGGSGPVPCLLLTTVGRRSGKQMTHPLVYGVDGTRYVIVASKGGADTQPQWYFNLLADPEVTLQVGPDTTPARALLADGAERQRLWKLMTDVYPPYDDYQSKTSRLIPIFALETSF